MSDRGRYRAVSDSVWTAKKQILHPLLKEEMIILLSMVTEYIREDAQLARENT